jgi:hypothetical protein
MRARFLGKDPESPDGDSATLFATDRTDRKTYVVQGWKIDEDAEVRQDIGEVPGHEDIVEVPEDVIKMWVRRYQEQEEQS